MSHERTIAVRSESRPRSAASKFCCPVGANTPGQSDTVEKLVWPFSTAALDETTLKVDAGAYAPCTARNSSGWPLASSSRAWYSAVLMPPVNSPGS